MSFIIAAYNEEKVIKDKIINTLDLDYPPSKFQIIVVSDGSNDLTPHIVRSFSDLGVLCFHQPERRGKTAALNRAVSHAEGEIIIFSDANTDFNREAIRQLVKYFSDKTVGGVTGLKYIRKVKGRASSIGDGLYWKYESTIKKCESLSGSITGGDGEIFAIQRLLYEPLDEILINDDAAITFNIVKKGYRILYETKAVSSEYASVSLKDDFYVKVRMVAGGFQTISYYWNFLFPPNTPFKLQFIAHKVLRWILPECLILILFSNIFLLDNVIYLYILFIQIAFYSLGAIGFLFFKNVEIPKVFYIPLYFIVMNAATFVGLLKYLNGLDKDIWRKAQR